MKSVYDFFIFILIIIPLVYSANAQQKSKYTLAKPLAFDKLYWMSSPTDPKQVFIVEVQGLNYKMLKIIYFPWSSGLRDGKTKFVDPKTLNRKTLWKLKLRKPSEDELFYCDVDNYFWDESKKIHLDSEGEPVLTFRSTQVNADVKFNNLSKMPCMILDSFSK